MAFRAQLTTPVLMPLAFTFVFYPLPECRVAFFLVLSILLLLLKDRRGLCGGCRSLFALVPLISDGTANDGQCCKDDNEQFGVDCIQHQVTVD